MLRSPDALYIFNIGVHRLGVAHCQSTKSRNSGRSYTLCYELHLMMFVNEKSITRCVGRAI